MGDMDALRKYGLRGFHYLPWTSDTDMAPDPPYRTRDITDRFSMLVDTEEGTIGGEMLGK